MGRPFKIRPPGEMSCPFCNRQQFPNNVYLKKHIRSHIKERPYMCHICDKDYIDSFTLFRHLASHEEETPFKCNCCNKGYKTKYALNSHKNSMHSGIPREKFECGTCGKQLSSKGHLKRHIDGVHMNLRPFQCSMCPLKYPNEPALKFHMVVHTGEKPFACNLCPRRFGINCNLIRHMKIHFPPSEDKRTCPVCKMVSTTIDNLKAHMRTHGEEKKIQCELCPEKFHVTSQLTSHMRIHTGEVIQECSKCKMQFRTTITRKAHERRNNCWQQCVVCVFCNKDFRNRKDPASCCEEHIISKHIKERPFMCTKCPAEFHNQNVLQNHFKKHHTSKLEDLIG